MPQVEEIVSQGTMLRVVATGAVENATFAQTGDQVVVTKAAHGRAVGDRIEVVTAVDGTGATGRATVTEVADGTFTFKASGTAAEPVSAKAMTYRIMHSVGIKSFNGPGGSAAVIDATNLSHRAKRKRIGMPDEGQLQCGVNFVPGNPAQEVLREARRKGTALQLELAFTDEPTSYMAFTGFCMTFAVSGAIDGLIEGSVTFEISGEIEEYQDAA